MAGWLADWLPPCSRSASQFARPLTGYGTGARAKCARPLFPAPCDSSPRLSPRRRAGKFLTVAAVQLLVFDEADKLLDDCFTEHIGHIVEALPKRKQLLATSAT